VFFEGHQRAPCRNADHRLSICPVWRLQYPVRAEWTCRSTGSGRRYP